MKVLFVCAGNIARSQMAEAFYNHFTNSRDAWSAGVYDFTPREYPHPTREVIDIMKEEGIDISKNKVKTVTKDMVKKSDRVYVMCEKEKCPGFLLDSENVHFWNIEDPFGKSIEEMKRIRDLIKSSVRSIL